MLLSLANNRIPLKFRANPKFLLLLFPAQLICFLLIYPPPFQDATSWHLPLPKISWNASSDWDLDDSNNPLPTPPPKWSGEENPAMLGAIVAGVKSNVEVEWTEAFTSNWTIHITDVLNTTTHFNKGHESMVYLEHILEHWDTLAPVTLFIHGHLESWHQDWPMDEAVGTLNLTEVEREGFVNLRCDWAHGCPDRVYTTITPSTSHVDVTSPTGEEYLVIRGIIELFPHLFPKEPFPDILASPCCAQFAVTRQAIHRRGKEFYEGLRQWLMVTKYNDHISGTVVERLWAYVFRGAGRDTVFCMSPQYCRCRFYNKCNPPPKAIQYSGPIGLGPQSVRFDIIEPADGAAVQVSDTTESLVETPEIPETPATPEIFPYPYSNTSPTETEVNESSNTNKAEEEIKKEEEDSVEGNLDLEVKQNQNGVEDEAELVHGKDNEFSNRLDMYIEKIGLSFNG